ncbi:hypothetical protein LTSEALA_1698 [Salmonella enterica subsp. enterica serovar Alachua str. R6-377]|uniref:Uncharacterized protein n=1 Tax=Salmonella enterica subsp. enterica serovar Alachua str. R6-377 TaxID=913241 RepID=G5LMC9_SALET|nr:hypothetical protein LTSEALA_1698 [Salmonella enterica subsp. enterica serovar Alachua str. R6-377]
MLTAISQKITPGLVSVIVAEQEGFCTVVAIGKYDHTAWILFSTAATKGDTVRMIEKECLYTVRKTLTSEDQPIQLVNHRHVDPTGLAIFAAIFIAGAV